jgi:PhnB protein
MAVQPIPEGYHTVTPYLIVKGAARAIEFYKKAFGATEMFRMPGPNDLIMHAEIKIGDSVVMLADEHPGMNYRSPLGLGGTTVSLLLSVADVDKSFAQALAAGATVQKPLQNQFWGDRMGTVADPFGHVWSLSTHIEDVPPEEMQRRMAAYKPT